MADKVGDEPADRHLAAKPIAFGLPRPQYLPEALFGYGHLPAEGAGARTRTRTRRFFHHRSVSAPPPPRPSPIEGEGGFAPRHARRAFARVRQTLSLRSMCVSSGMPSCLRVARDDTLPHLVAVIRGARRTRPPRFFPCP